ncbi:MAG: hypothetical protein AB3A66_29510 (plasmid) [Nodularia sp. CChRGM 3473]
MTKPDDKSRIHRANGDPKNKILSRRGAPRRAKALKYLGFVKNIIDTALDFIPGKCRKRKKYTHFSKV